MLLMVAQLNHILVSEINAGRHVKVQQYKFLCHWSNLYVGILLSLEDGVCASGRCDRAVASGAEAECRALQCTDNPIF